MTAQPSIYQIALEQPQRGLAGQLRVVIARVAASDPTWCRTYDAMIAACDDTGLRHPETHPLEQSTTYPGPVFIADPSTSADQASRLLRQQAQHLGAEDVLASELDLVAAVIGAEVWMAALSTDNLAYAAAKGPDAIASAAAILARVCGAGVQSMPLDPDWPTLRFPMEQVLEALRHARTWSDRVLRPEDWAEVTARVVTDLGYFAGGGTKTHDASLLLGVRMLGIEPLD